MSDQKHSEVVHKLEALRQRFAERARSEIEQLQLAVSRFREGDIGHDALVSMYQSLHRLSGSAGTFGYGLLGEEARSLETQLKPLFSTDAGVAGTPVKDLVTPEFMDRVERLQSLVQQGQEVPEPGRHDASPTGEARSESRLVLVVDPESNSAKALAEGVQLHGFQARVFDSLPAAGTYDDSDVAAVVVQASVIEEQADVPAAYSGLAPIICIGAEDSFEQRYALAALGIDGFLPEPVNIPVLVDYIERLSAEWVEQGSGRVMIVDDDQELLEHYALVLEQAGLDVCAVSDPSQILRVLSGFRPDIVLMDVQMGAYSGAHLARMLRYDPEWLGLPIIYLSSEEDRDSQVAALSEGGDDFLTKPVSDRFLVNTVKVRCYRARQLDKLVSRDSLTGLLKHGVVQHEILKEHARCQRLGQQSVVAMLDLDHFKRVNDRFGHRTGDAVIKGLANLLRNRLRKTDILGRYGGEEFVVVLPDCSLENARVVLQSVCDQLSRIVFSGDGQEFSVTVSIGVAPLQAYPSSEDAIEAADQALYRRKQNGRNGVCVAGDTQPKNETVESL